MDWLRKFLEHNETYKQGLSVKRWTVYLAQNQVWEYVEEILWDWNVYTHQLHQADLIRQYWKYDINSDKFRQLWIDFVLNEKTLNVLYSLGLIHDLGEIKQWDVCKNWNHKITEQDKQAEKSEWLKILEQIFQTKSRALWVLKDIYLIDFEESQNHPAELKRIFELYEWFWYLRGMIFAYKQYFSWRKDITNFHYLLHNICSQVLYKFLQYERLWIESVKAFLRDNKQILDEILTLVVNSKFEDKNWLINSQFVQTLNMWTVYKHWSE